MLAHLNSRSDASDLSAVAGVVSGVVAAITAWQEYGGADRKINRYTSAIVSLRNHLLWWDSLTPVDQNSQSNIDRLVSIGEEIKLAEVHSWAVSSPLCGPGSQANSAGWGRMPCRIPMRCKKRTAKPQRPTKLPHIMTQCRGVALCMFMSILGFFNTTLLKLHSLPLYLANFSGLHRNEIAVDTVELHGSRQLHLGLSYQLAAPVW